MSRSSLFLASAWGCWYSRPLCWRRPTHRSVAQFGGTGPGTSGAVTPPLTVTLKEPVASRVYQRDLNGKAEIPIVLDDSLKDAKLIDAASLTGPNVLRSQSNKFVDGKLVGVPAGGPYTITVHGRHQRRRGAQTVGPVFVGDLWVLAGQSNMEGVGNLIDVTPPHPKVMLLGMDGKWGQAEEPLHWLIDSPDPVHSGDPKNRAERAAQTHKTRTKGAGLGLTFAVAMVESTGVPVGLVACAHGGTSMEQWNPSKKEQGGASLYGSMLRQVKLAGGKVKGVLWYQGESDANAATPGKFSPKSSPASSRPSVPISDSLSCPSTTFRSAGSSATAIPKTGTPCKKPSV